MAFHSVRWPACLLMLGLFGMLLCSRRGDLVPASGEHRPHAEIENAGETIESPRLAALVKELKGGNQAALDQFWNEIRGKAPLVEPIPGDSNRSWVTFVWRGDGQTQSVGLGGGPPPVSGRTPLTRLAQTDVWYRTERIPNEARFAYYFHVNFPDKRPNDPASLDALISRFPPLSDPLNSRHYQMRSLVELPGAPPQPWIERLRGADQGKVTECKLQSKTLKEQREFIVYTPPHYDPHGEPCGLLILFDGPPDQETATLDNLIFQKKIPPLVAVFVKHIDRSKELSCSELFADFLAQEMVPWVRENYRVSREPRRVIVRGTSLGGLMASYCALRHAEVFGNVLSQSGSYQWFPGGIAGTAPPHAETGWLTRRFVEAPRSAVAFYLEAGSFEHFFPYSLLAENRRLRDVLEAKGYTVHYSEFSGNHDPINWRGSFAHGLIALVGVPGDD